LGAVVFILNETGSALGFVMFKERFTFWVKGPWKKGREKNKTGKYEGRRDARLNPRELLGWRVTDIFWTVGEWVRSG
jgi:hypothetical protein